MANVNTFSEEIREMRDAAGFVTQVFGENYADVSDFMVNLAGQETLYGTMSSQRYDDGMPVSITEFQIDPIRFLDMLDRSKKGEALKRIEMINETFTNLGYQDFDIRNIATVGQHEYTDPITGEEKTQLRYEDVNRKYLDDPYVTTSLARHILASNPDTIPSDLAGQATYWKTNWNSMVGEGEEGEFIEKFDTYRKSTDIEDDVMDMLREQDDDPFKITPSISEPEE
jgi:hypothetical protein